MDMIRGFYTTINMGTTTGIYTAIIMGLDGGVYIVIKIEMNTGVYNGRKKLAKIMALDGGFYEANMFMASGAYIHYYGLGRRSQQSHYFGLVQRVP
jgi:hypothetical protein